MALSSNVKVPPDWSSIPKVSTRTELLNMRKKCDLPDISFDLDGDGVVSSKDYYLGKRFDADGDGKLNPLERSKALNAINSGLDDQLVWGCDSSGINRSFRIVQKRGEIILNEEFQALKSTYPEFPSIDHGTVKSKSELESLRKQEIKLKGKYYEGKMHKEYRLEVTDPTAVTPNSHKPMFGDMPTYKETPSYKTKNEMLTSKRQQLLEELNASCNFAHKNQYERLLSRERHKGNSPTRKMISIQEKVREENMAHFSETYANRPIGIHGIELPRFSENLKEYWKVSSKNASENSSWKKIETKEENDFDKKFDKRRKDDRGIEKISSNEDFRVTKEFNRNSRWTNYHYNFIVKPAKELVKVATKSTTPDVASKVKAFKTPKSLIVQRMMKKGNFSPGKDKLRSTGFS